MIKVQSYDKNEEEQDDDDDSDGDDNSFIISILSNQKSFPVDSLTGDSWLECVLGKICFAHSAKVACQVSLPIFDFFFSSILSLLLGCGGVFVHSRIGFYLIKCDRK